ncbi:MAG TPA: hypothetical protein VGK03_10375 [Geothrix sp.]|jgi:hypothetical protein
MNRKVLFIIGGTVLLAGGLASLPAAMTAPATDFFSKVVPQKQDPRIISKELEDYIERGCGRKLTDRNRREVRLWVDTAIDNGCDEREINFGLDRAISLAKKNGIAEGLSLASDIMTMGTALGREPTRFEEERTERWRRCSRRIKQIEEGLI